MGKALDDRVVEYAYLESLTFIPNQEYLVLEGGVSVTKYRHVLSKKYILKNPSSEELGRKSLNKVIKDDMDEMEEVADFLTNLETTISSEIGSDKTDLSGYTG